MNSDDQRAYHASLLYYEKELKASERRVAELTDERDKAIEAGAAMLDVAGRKEMRLRALTDAARAVCETDVANFVVPTRKSARALRRLRAVLDDRPNPEVAAFLERELPTVDSILKTAGDALVPSEETSQP